MLTRTQLLQVSGYTETGLQSLVRRHLPHMLQEWKDPSPEDLERWTTKRHPRAWKDALTLRAVDQFAGRGGLSLATAFAAAANVVTVAEVKRIADADCDYWGAVAFYDPKGVSYMAGTLDEISDHMRPAPKDWTGYDVARLDLVNLSAAARKIEAAATEIGLIVDWSK